MTDTKEKVLKEAQKRREIEIRRKLAELQTQGFKSASEKAASKLVKSSTDRFVRVPEPKDKRAVTKQEILKSLSQAGSANGPSLSDSLCCTNEASTRSNRLWGADGDYEVAKSIRLRGVQSASCRSPRSQGSVRSICSNSFSRSAGSIIGDVSSRRGSISETSSSGDSRSSTPTPCGSPTKQNTDSRQAQRWWMEQVAREAQVARARRELMKEANMI